MTADGEPATAAPPIGLQAAGYVPSMFCFLVTMVPSPETDEDLVGAAGSDHYRRGAAEAGAAEVGPVGERVARKLRRQQLARGVQHEDLRAVSGLGPILYRRWHGRCPVPGRSTVFPRCTIPRHLTAICARSYVCPEQHFEWRCVRLGARWSAGRVPR